MIWTFLTAECSVLPSPSQPWKSTPKKFGWLFKEDDERICIFRKKPDLLGERVFLWREWTQVLKTLCRRMNYILGFILKIIRSNNSDWCLLSCSRGWTKSAESYREISPKKKCCCVGLLANGLLPEAHLICAPARVFHTQKNMKKKCQQSNKRTNFM